MKQPAALSPWLVLVVFTPTALVLWVVAMRIVPLEPATFRLAYQIVPPLQLFLAVVLYETYARQMGGAELSWRGLLLALLTLIIPQLSHLLVAYRSLGSPDMALVLSTLLHQVVLIALVEELWFRGLWMQATASSPALAILGGAAGFGLYHLHQGPAMVVTTAAIGLLFAVARWRGAPIWALALAHGVSNWINSPIAPAPGWRFDPALSRALFIALILAGAAAIWFGRRPPRQQEADDSASPAGPGR
jgi:membrane protease YdiL (CAAX protease family)